ncbi:cytochrome c oxidase assembly factor 5-like [Hibiscus syriacus]|uniref:cytochrome c oxidase assembly factor 5-like n=1 Tax=Hibiscus syriacus TaxID=106335 RepID=UPI0019236A23|nr:cytochrome c oxidase assembly factor 5-like [Hibiscus syriacus]
MKLRMLLHNKRRELTAKDINTLKKRIDAKLKNVKSCKGLAMELVKCLSESVCVKVEKRSFRECAGEKSPSIPSECVGLGETYFNCKRGQVDMRARIRGNKDY